MKKHLPKDRPCPCLSGQPYGACCLPFHEGKRPKTPVELMRSRFSAYALSILAYIIDTTHPANDQFDLDQQRWAQTLSTFCRETQFAGLEILGFQEGDSWGTVTFFARLIQGGKDVSFTEKSYFEHLNGKWLYRSGRLVAGRVPDLIL